MNTKTEILKETFREFLTRKVIVLPDELVIKNIERYIDQVREQTLEEVERIIKDDFENVLTVDNPDNQIKKNWNGIMQLSKNRMIQALTKLKGEHE